MQFSRGQNTESETAKNNVRPCWRIFAARAAFALLFVLLAFSGAVMSVTTLGRSAYRWHGFVVELRLLPASRGETALVFMPLGEVRARTHRAPVILTATLQQIEVDGLRNLLDKSPTTESVARDFEQTARAALRNFVARQMLFAALGALIAPTLLRCRRMRYYFMSGVIGLLVMGVTLGSVFTTFNGKAFATPIYSGALKEAPWVIRFGQDAFTKIEALSTKLQTVASNLNVLYGRLAVVSDSVNSEAGAIRILHISDIHNNPASIDFIRKVAEQFRVDFIVDTGDLTDFGSPPETVLVQQIGKLPYPYVFVAGNHDSRTVTAALAKLKNVTVLGGQIAEVKGLRLLGLPNPASARAGVGSVDTTPQELEANANQLLQAYQNAPAKPDIIAVHDPKQGQSLWGIAPLILCGHLHTPSIQRQSAPPQPAPPGTPFTIPTLLCNAGSTGAAGLRYFEGPNKTAPFTCAVLTFRPDPAPPTPAPAAPASPPPAARPRLRAIDMIVLDGKLDEYSISHTVY